VRQGKMFGCGLPIFEPLARPVQRPFAPQSRMPMRSMDAVEISVATGRRGTPLAAGTTSPKIDRIAFKTAAYFARFHLGAG
jgi:hypothetical protein